MDRKQLERVGIVIAIVVIIAVIVWYIRGPGDMPMAEILPDEIASQLKDVEGEAEILPPEIQVLLQDYVPEEADIQN